MSWEWRKQSPKKSVFIQLFREKLSEKNVHATIPNGNMGYDQYTVPNDSCRTYFCCFPLAPANICPCRLSCYSFKFLWRTVKSKPPTITIGIVACTFSDNLSRNSYIPILLIHSTRNVWKTVHVDVNNRSVDRANSKARNLLHNRQH